MSEKNEWKLVPVEPTAEMWAAVNKLDDEMAAGAYDGKGASIEQIWACLVDAAPCPTCNDQGAVGNILNAEPCPDCTPAPSAPGDAQDERQEWMTCESRRPWVSNGLKAYAQELRDKERRCRTAYNKDFMGVPALYVADACAEAAAVFEAKLAALAAQVPQQGEA